MIISCLYCLFNKKCVSSQIKISYSNFKCKDTNYWQYFKIIADNWIVNCLIFCWFCRVALYVSFLVYSATRVMVVLALHTVSNRNYDIQVVVLNAMHKFPLTLCVNCQGFLDSCFFKFLVIVLLLFVVYFFNKV